MKLLFHAAAPKCFRIFLFFRGFFCYNRTVMPEDRRVLPRPFDSGIMILRYLPEKEHASRRFEENYG